eukprot:Skav228954  [mRNA]  locus=scaffold3820:90112:92322:- [translate_table: standard]
MNYSDVKPCNESNFANDVMMSSYLDITGDTGGVVTLPDGKRIGNCPDGYWWPGPKCRGDMTKCILYLTAGAGYGMATMQQKITRWNMPVAIGVAKTWGIWGMAPEWKSVFYWWVPDPTFLAYSPVTTSFPPYDKQAWEAGDVSTAASVVPLGKLVSGDLSSLNPRLERFIDKITLDMDVLNKALLEHSQSGHPGSGQEKRE